MARILITGASSGIGKSLYEYFSKRGKTVLDKVVGVSRRGPDIKMDLIAAGPDEIAVIPKVHGNFHVAIINHGIMPFEEAPNQWQVIQTNLLSYWRFLELGSLLVKPGGVFILIGSTAGLQGAPDLPLYAATKAAVINLTRSYAASLAVPERIRVNCISPGIFKTNLAGGEPLPGGILAQIPMGREGDVQELLPVVLAIIQCPYMTGTNIVVDGGYTLPVV